MKSLLRPKVLIPLIFGASAIAALLAFGDARKVLTSLLGFQWQYLLYFCLLMLGYEAMRVVQWRFLLNTLDIHVPLRTALFTFLAGEVAKTLPIGNFVPSYLLSQSKGAKLGTATAASSLIIAIEVIVSLIGLVLLGIGDWGWLRPTILAGLLLALVAGWAILKFYDDARPPAWMTNRERIRKALREVRNFREGAGELLRPRVLVVELVFGAIYLTLAGLGLYVITLGLGIQHLAISQALAAYFFALAIGLLVLIPVDVGLIEMGGIAALLAFGVGRSAAVSTMLLFRVLSLAASLLISALAMVVLRDELRRALRSRKQDGTPPQEADDQHALTHR